ncbi:hypothetical protein Q2941_29180 [Bradyrhizobium sp. UFLA05-153]|uniref:hypothetical protein n=1 Tax=Bradyrhizobium sp. Ec3.3 TaxID=189753 RepID=UPI000420326E
MEWVIVMKRHRFKHEKLLGERLAKAARLAREKADQLPPGAERDALLEKARQADATAHIDGWLNSPGLKPPT